jgi:hypothetical protein
MIFLIDSRELRIRLNFDHLIDSSRYLLTKYFLYKSHTGIFTSSTFRLDVKRNPNQSWINLFRGMKTNNQRFCGFTYYLIPTTHDTSVTYREEGFFGRFCVTFFCIFFITHTLRFATKVVREPKRRRNNLSKKN